MSQLWERASAINPWWPETRYMIGWPFAHTCAANCPYCFVHDGFTQQAATGGRWWSDDEAVIAWRGLEEQVGPCHIVFSGLEPGEQLPLVGRVLAHHRGALLTNMSLPVSALQKHCPPDRLRLHPSYHPHLWGLRAEPFLARLMQAQQAGYTVLQAAIVAYPPYLSRLEEWREAFRGQGVRLVTIPYQGIWRDARYPMAYSAEEWEVVRSGVAPALQGERAVPPKPMTSCAAGYVCAYITMSGAVQRCSEVGGMGEQNLMRDQGIDFLKGPAPCPRTACPCTQFHIYHVQ